MIKNNGYPDLKIATRYLDDNLFDNFIRRYNEVDDVLITLVGNGIGNIALFPRKKSAIIQNTIGLRFKDNKKFMYYLLLSKNEVIVKLDRGMAQPSIRQDELKAINVNLPHIKEQDKISSLMVNIDNLITLHQRKWICIFYSWEQRKLDDLGIATGGTSIETEFSSNGKYKVISIGSYSENSTYNDQGIRAIHSDKTKIRVLNKEDLTMILNDKTASGRIIGRVLYIEKSGEYVYNQRTERIEINRNLYNPRFIYHLLNAPEMRNKIIKQSQGNTQIFVNWNGIKNTEYLIPDLSEQSYLEKIFNNIDNLITLHQH